MRWLIGLLILLQLPVVFIVFLAGGTDGKMSSLALIYSVTIPIFVCSLFALYRLATASRLMALDVVAICIAFLPAAWLALSIARNAMKG